MLTLEFFHWLFAYIMQRTMPVEVIFCSLLNEFIGADDHRLVTIINDRQKGLLWGLEKY